MDFLNFEDQEPVNFEWFLSDNLIIKVYEYVDFFYM